MSVPLIPGRPELKYIVVTPVISSSKTNGPDSPKLVLTPTPTLTASCQPPGPRSSRLFCRCETKISFLPHGRTPFASGVVRSLLKDIQCPSTVMIAWPSVAGVLISGPSFCGAPQLSDSELRFATQMSCGKFGVGPSRTEKYRLSPSLEMNGW